MGKTEKKNEKEVVENGVGFKLVSYQHGDKLLQDRIDEQIYEEMMREGERDLSGGVD